MLVPGSQLGRYEIRSLIGAGGMGEVYLAHDTQLHRPVALKVLAAGVRNDDELRRRLAYEARAASALNHPNILIVYDIGEQDGEHFIATEYVDGITLRQKMQQEEPGLPEVIDIGVQLASALAAAEAAGLVHRDVKPDNIMVRGDGYVKLLDFGLARSLVAGKALKQTEPFVVRGTVFYMSPEQLRGMIIDSRSDIWSTGVVLYELASGKLPFEGEVASDVVAAILKTEPAPLRLRTGESAPQRLAQIVARAMHKDRNARYQTARELFTDLQRLRADLEKIATGGPETTERVDLAEPPPNNLPRQLTALVGRENEQREILELLRRDDVRLVTLTGPGGTGKTRLGIALGEELLREVDDGVLFVPLAAVADARHVVSEIAAALDVREGGATELDSVKRALRDRTLLLILDNFEQIVDAGPVIADILAAAPRVKAIVTSRSPLRVAGEREYAVPPLPTPPLERESAHDTIDRFASVALFVQRAQAVKSDFTITPENARAIAELCVRLDGLPLAIELAASRVKVLPPQAMLSRASQRLELLTGGRRDLPERQQTMRNAISWGYNLLEDHERKLYAALSVFRGGFSLTAAEALMRGDPAVLEGVSSLVDKSFLRPIGNGADEPRFLMLETIREYGLECLGEAGRAADLQREHARVMAELAEDASADRSVPQFVADHENLRAALEWSIANGETDIAMRLAAATWWYWYLHGHYTEGRRWLGAALAMPGSTESGAYPAAMSGAGALAFLQCDYERAISLLDASIDAARERGDRRSLAHALQFRGSVARERGDYDRALDLHALSMTIWTELGDVANADRSMNYIAFASWLKGDFGRAAEIAARTLPLFQKRGDVEGIAWSLLNFAASSLYGGDLDRAEQRVDEALSWSRAGGFKEGVAWSLNLAGCVLRARGELERARAILKDSLQLHWELGDRWRSTSVLEQLAALAAGRGRPHDAARMFGAAEAMRARLGTPVPPAELPQYERDVAILRGFDEDWNAGVAAPIDEAIHLALA